jgi:hypothetical protein
MSPQLEAFLVILAYAVAALLGSWSYFRRYAITRPPIGVFNLWDVAIMLGGIVLVPYLYLALPLWLVAGLLALGMLSALYFLVEPMLRSAWTTGLATIGLAAADIGAMASFGETSVWFFTINNLVLILVVVGLVNLWAQSGMRARDVTILAGVLAIYNLIATWLLPLMIDMIKRLSALPFVPLVAWPAQEWRWLGIGLGHLLLAAVFPLVARKAFGPSAGRAALAISLCAIAGVLILPILGITYAAFPVMIVLGPLMIAQYAYWRRLGAERTTLEYRRLEPHRSSLRESASP